MESTAKSVGIEEDVSRRALVGALAGLGAVFGLSALTGCAAEEPVAAEGDEKLGRVSSAASGSTVGWADAIADLRAMPATPPYAVVVAQGYLTAGDGGGGAFGWTTDTVTPDDGGLTIVPTAGSRTGCFKRLGVDHIDVKWFGAKGDNIADDTVPIQNAITACGNANGGLVFFSPGTYRTTGSLFVRKGNVVLIGT